MSFVLDDMEKLARTGAKLVFILVVRSHGVAVGGEQGAASTMASMARSMGPDFGSLNKD
jgi:hypothetical protein